MKTSFEMPAQRDLLLCKTLSFAFVFAVGILMVGPSQAATIQLLFDDLDISYSDATDTITEIGNPDTLNNVNFVVDGNLAGTVTGGALELSIPGIPAIADGVDSILVSDPNGTLTLDLGGGDFLDLTLNEVTVVYLHAAQALQFFAGGSVAAINGQSLPFGLIIGDPVSMSFSTRLNTMSSSGGFVTSFTASGTGEISGAAIPEPTSLGLLALGGLLGSMAAYRYRLG